MGGYGCYSHAQGLHGNAFVVDGFRDERFRLLQVSLYGCLYGFLDAVDTVTVGLEIGMEYVLPLPRQSGTYPNLGQRPAVLLDEGEGVRVVVEPMNVAGMSYLVDEAVVLVLDGACGVAAQHIAIVERGDHHRQLGAVGFPDGGHLLALARAVGVGGSAYSQPPAIELAGLRINLVLEQVESLQDLFLYAILCVDLSDELVEVAHVRPSVVVPLEMELAVVDVEDLRAVTVGALRLLACIQQRGRFTYLNAHIAPLGVAGRRSVGDEQAHGVGSILVLEEIWGPFTAVLIDERLQAVEAFGILFCLGVRSCCSEQHHQCYKTNLLHGYSTFNLQLSTFNLQLSGSHHAVDADDDEGDGEDLSHVDGQRGFEGFLNLLGVLDEEAEGEDVGQTEAEVPACAHVEGLMLLAVGELLVDAPHNHKQQGVGDGLVELAGMTGHRVDLLKDEGPGHVGHLADNLAVHEVAQADEAGCCASGDGDVVEHRPDAQLRALTVEPEGQHEAGCTAM